MVIAGTRSRFFRTVLPGQTGDWILRQSRLPLTTAEVKERVMQRYERDEQQVLRLLATEGQSVSGGIFLKLNLTRTVIRGVMEALKDSRAIQSTFSSIVCATRFKYFFEDVLLPTECQYCGGVDSLEHLIECVSIGAVPESCEEVVLVEYLAELARRAQNVNPKYPVPIIPRDGVEIALLNPSDSEGDEGEEGPEHCLDFENDLERTLDLDALAEGREEAERSVEYGVEDERVCAP